MEADFEESTCETARYGFVATRIWKPPNQNSDYTSVRKVNIARLPLAQRYPANGDPV